MSRGLYYQTYGKRLDKMELYRWLAKIFKLLRSGKLVVIFPDRRTIAANERILPGSKRKKPPHFFGDATDKETSKKIIRLNPYRRGFFNSLLHECLHLVAPDMPHALIYRLPEMMVRQMTSSHYARLLKLLARNIRYQPKVKK